VEAGKVTRSEAAVLLGPWRPFECSCTSASVKVSATPLTRVSHELQQAVSQKRQGTKSREVVHMRTLLVRDPGDLTVDQQPE
jgi:hypothetical protein